MPLVSLDEPTTLPSETVPAPPVIDELARACVRYVEDAIGMRLDYEAETLPLLDHYLASCREDLASRPALAGLVARAAGAYFGEVVRRRIRTFWHVPTDDPSGWELRAQPVYLSFNPVQVAHDVLSHGDEEGPTSRLELDDEDRDLVEARLAQLPAVTEKEFYSLSMWLEVIEIAVDAAKARMMRDGAGDVVFAPEDYVE
jgi:hypothetical protein